MEIVLIILVIVVIALVGFNVSLLLQWKRSQEQGSQNDDKSMQLLNQNVQGMQQRLDRVSQGLNERLDNAARVIGSVNKELGSMKEIGRNMQALQDFLKSPKLRGNIGEQVLQQMLDQYFPHHLYDMQYRFSDGQIVDAILKTDNGIIPIDSKFPMENYQRMTATDSEDERARYLREFVKDVKKHVNDISKKYILPDQGTVDFAIMYVPSEAVYYEIIRNDIDINAHGLDKKVLFVSPNSFYYFLRVLMQGMKEKRIADAAREVIDAIHGIQKDTQRFADTLALLDRHLGHAQSALDKTNKEFGKLQGKIEQIDDVDESRFLS